MSARYDGLAIPDFLLSKEKTVEERIASWDRLFGDRPLRETRFIPDAKKAMDPEVAAAIAELKEKGRIKTHERIAKMKMKKTIDPKQHEWNAHRGGYYWRGTKVRVQFNEDGSARARGPSAAIARTPSPIVGPDIALDKENAGMAIREKLAELNAALSAGGKPTLKVWKASAAALQERIDKERGPAKTFGDPVKVREIAAAEVAPPAAKAKPADKHDGHGRGRLWQNTPPSDRPKECKPIRPGTKRHRALIMMTEGTHTVAQVSADIGANAIAHAFCLKRDSGIGYEFLDPKTGARVERGSVDMLIRAVWPEGLSLKTQVREK